MATVDNTTTYAEIVKYDEQTDGTLLVYGKATDDTLDSDQQVCDPNWLSTAMPEWFKYGNIREQHSSIAAGVATEYEAKGDGHYITAHVVDPNSVKKVKSKVLKGFSIGIRAPRVVKDNKAIGGRIVDGTIVEVSLVDRPANPSCTLVMAKAIGTEVVQVSEYSENSASGLIASSKKYASEINKFDQGAFDTARRALATLIQVEAGELAEGEDETHSLSCLLMAVHALFEWHEGEAMSGETEPIANPEGEEKADGPEMCDKCHEPMDKCNCDSEKSEDIEMCNKCHESMDKCKCDSAKSDSIGKCLECGCHQPAEDHGRTDVTTAEIVSNDKAITVSDALREIVMDAVKSLLPVTEKTGGDDVETKADESERIEALESELAQVKALAVPNGPRRMGVVSSNPVNESLTKASYYRRKAEGTLDKALADGYRQLAVDLEKSES